MQYNDAATKELAKKTEIIKLLNWLKENDCIFDKVQWPAVYGNGLVGCLALEDIKPLEAFVYVPIRCQMSVEHAKASEIGVMFTNHDSLFVGNYYRDVLIVCIFLMYERMKGEDSFWAPFINTLDAGVPTAYWDEAILDKSDYLEFKYGLECSKTRYDDEWDKV